MTLFNIETLDDASVDLHRYIASILYLMGNIGTILSALVFFKKSWRKNVCVFYFNTCLFINLGYINSTMLGSNFIFGFNINAQNSSRVLCKLFYFISYLFSTLFPTILILASIDRLLISSQNIDTRLYSSKRLAYFSISISTLFWLIFYSHVLFKTDIQEIYPSVFVCYYDISGFYFQFISYSTLIVAIGLAVILIILSIFSFKNVQRIRSVPRQQRQQFRLMTKKDFQLLRCLYIHDIVYIVFSGFLAVYYVYAAATKDQTLTLFHQAIDTFLDSFGIFIHHIPYCASFFIFISISKAFRQEIKRFFYRIFGRNPPTIRAEDNTQQNDRNNEIELNVISTIMLRN